MKKIWMKFWNDVSQEMVSFPPIEIEDFSELDEIEADNHDLRLVSITGVEER